MDELGDAGILENVSRSAIANISSLLKCEESEIKQIRPLNTGLTNVSFSFDCHGEKYVYRHPGMSSSSLVNRHAEVIAQNCAISAGIDTSVIDISEEGWKLSHFVPSSRPFDYNNFEDLDAGVGQIRAFHRCGARCDYDVNLLMEGDRLLLLAAAKKGEAVEKLSKVREQVERVWHHVELDAWPKVLCHNDTYAVNWIVGDDGLCMIDWEYAGMNDPMNDLATMVVRDGLSQSKAEEILKLYFKRDLNYQEKRHAYGIFVLCAWYWTCWCMFKDTLGEDGYFMLFAWRTLKHYLPLVLEMFEGEKAVS